MTLQDCKTVCCRAYVAEVWIDVVYASPFI